MSDLKRIVFVSAMGGAPWGGSEELWSQAALRLRDEGHEISASVVWWPKLSPKIRALSNAGIKLYMRKSTKQYAFVVRIWRAIQRRAGWTPKEFAWLIRQKPDLVIVSQGGISDGGKWMDFCRQAGLPFVSIVQCNCEHWWLKDAERSLMATAYCAARKVFCVSRHNLELLERQIGERLPNATVVWNPVKVSQLQLPVWPAENGVWKMACVARLEPSAKGQDLLLCVLALPKWRERPIEVNLYGAGDWEETLKKLASRLELANVRFRGHVADVVELWRHNHVLVLPSRYEGLPLALVEAMQCARPAVITDIGGNAELCVDEETGFVATAPTVISVNEALERAWRRRFDWQAMGKAARARVEKLIPKDPVGDFCRQLLELR